MLPNAPANTRTLGTGAQPATTINLKTATVIINGQLYVRPAPKQQLDNYAKNAYGLPALMFTSVRAAVAQGRGKPKEWGQGGGARPSGSVSGSCQRDNCDRRQAAVAWRCSSRKTHYIPSTAAPCTGSRERAAGQGHGAHDTNGRGFFTLTPTLSDMSGPMIAEHVWIPGHTTIDGFTGSRLIFA